MLTMILANSTASFWMPNRGSTIAPEVDWLFYFILGITVFFTLLIFGLVVGLVLKYRYSERNQVPRKTASHSTALELTWTVIPTIIVVVIFYYGFDGFLH